MLGIGEKLRAARLDQNLSLRELAARAEVSPSLLSQIETGKVNPSVRSLHSIADALSVPIDHFFPNENENEGEAGSVLTAGGGMTASEFRAMQLAEPAENLDIGFESQERAEESPVMHLTARPTIELEGGVTWARLTPGPENGIEFLQICYEVSASSGKRMSHHVGREFGLILEGELLLELGFERYLLKAGDSIIFDSTTPHRLTNAGQVTVRAIWVVMDRY
jgi:transcriptional regulator with XRE-family HTH domain